MHIILALFTNADYLNLLRARLRFQNYLNSDNKRHSLWIVIKNMSDIVFKKKKTSIKEDMVPLVFLKNIVVIDLPSEAHFCFPFCLVGNLVQLCTIMIFNSNIGP